jgi:hypothetical protein
MIGNSDKKRQRLRRAAIVLDVALCQHANGSFAAVAWCAAGRPKDSITPRHLELYQSARSIVHANGGQIIPGDAARLVRVMRGTKRSSE